MSSMPSPSSFASRRGPPFVLVAAFLIGVALRFAFLDAKTLWLDEIWSITVARMSWPTLAWSLLHQDPNMGLYDALLHLWMRLGQNEFAIRSLSAVAGACSIPVVYLIGCQLFDSRVAGLASMLLAVNIFHIQYSQEARSYSLWVLLCSLSTFYFIRAIARNRPIDWITYSAVAVLAVYAHLFAWMTIAAHCCSTMLLRKNQLTSKGLVFSIGSIGILSTPLLFLIYARTRSPFFQLDWVPRPDLRRVYNLFYTLCGNANFYGIEIPKLRSCNLLPLGGLIAASVALIAAIRFWRSFGRTWTTWHHFLPFLCVVVPVLLALMLSLRMPMFLNRYFLVCVPPFSLILSFGILSMRRRWLAILTAGVIFAAESAALVQYFQYRVAYREWQLATSYILSHSRPGDALIFSMAHGRLLFDFYKDRYHEHSGELDELYPDLTRVSADPGALSYYPQPSAAQLNAITAHSRVWLVLYPEDRAPQAIISTLFRSRLQSAFPSEQKVRIDTVILCLYVRDDSVAKARFLSSEGINSSLRRHGEVR